MKSGISISMVRNLNNTRMILEMEENVLEEIMSKHSISNPKDVYIFPPTVNKKSIFCYDFFVAVIRVMLNELKLPSDYPVVWDDFKLRNSVSLPGTADRSLLEVMEDFNHYLPNLPELPKQRECMKCGRNLPEPDGFGGVTIEGGRYGRLVCFKCYTEIQNYSS